MLLKTSHLILRPFTLADTAFIIELLNTEGWLKNIGDRNVRTEEQAIQYLQNGPLKSYADNGFGLSMVALKENDQPIGMAGLIKRPTLDNIDIGFAFLPEFAGKGYGYEISTALLDHAFNTLNIDKVAAITIPSNEPSINLLKKLGFTFEQITGSNGEELMLFGIHKT